MSEITPYEQLIAAKLDQVPVPDMADSIWSDIEMQLDASADVPAGSPKTFKDIQWYSLAAIAAAAVIALLWWYFIHKGPNATPPPKPLPETHAPMPVTPPPPAENPHTSPRTPKKRIIPTIPFQNIPKDSARTDTPATQIPPPPKPDSSAVRTPRINLPDVDLYETHRPPPPPAGKKHRGVPGISDDDYKITASKDSARKKN